MPNGSFAAFIAALAISLVLTPFVIRLATRLRILDLPGAIKHHARPVPAVGGLAIYASILAASAVAILLNARIRTSFLMHSRFWFAIAASATMVLAVGLYD
ncbi:MAG TPA: hypothetical protein VLN41_02760, partial [Candidatus Bathyarchaeia archaeon]|nr:hypothetical protein [Candidatus Bathyarchaeia archaeon]